LASCERECGAGWRVYRARGMGEEWQGRAGRRCGGGIGWKGRGLEGGGRFGALSGVGGSIRVSREGVCIGSRGS